MPLDPSIDYEHLPPGDAMDETDINLRTHFSRMSDEKLAEYSSNLTNEEVMKWDAISRTMGPSCSCAASAT